MSSPAPAIGSRSALDRVFAVLEERGLHPRRSPRSVVAQCPAHSDSIAADFTARWVPSRGGQVRLACQRCSAEQTVLLEALGLQAGDLLDSPDGRGASLPRRSVAAPANRLGPLPRRLTSTRFPVQAVAAAAGGEPAGLDERARELWARSHEADRAASTAELAAGNAQVALDEVHAQLAAAAATKRGSTAAKTHRRFAVRWAQEAVRHVRSAQAAAERARAVDATVLALADAEQSAAALVLPGRDAVQRAGAAHDTAQRLALQSWTDCEAPMPAAVHQALVRAVPTTADIAAAEPEAGGGGGEVLPFPPGGGDGGGGGSRRPGSPVRWTEYERLPTGVIVERRYNRDGQQHLQGILSLDARILQIEYAEVESPGDDLEVVDSLTMSSQGSDIQPERMVLHYVLGYTHPATGELIKVRVSADRARAGDWLGELPQHVQYEPTARGRARVWDAIKKTSPEAEIVTAYATTGWRNLPGHGWTYIHAGGGITSRGPVNLPVNLPGTLGRVDMPEPVGDPAVIRRLFNEHSRALMTRVAPYVGAMLVGTAYRAVLGWTAPSTMVYGLPETYKSGVAALAMHHFGTRWDRGLPTVSMSVDGGSTLQAIRDELWAAKDCLFFADDAAPDKGVAVASAFLGQLTRMQYNRQARDRKHPKTGEVIAGKASRCTFLGTSEVRAAAESGQQRMNILDLAKGELSLDRIIELDQPSSRLGRATVMASLLQWMAGQGLGQLTTWRKQRYAQIAGRRRTDGVGARGAELAELEIGWELVARFLSNIGAYTQAEAEAMLVEVRAALTEAQRRGQDQDAPTSVGERCRSYIASALRAGAIHLSAIGGTDPPMPEMLACGYRRVRVPDPAGTVRNQMEPQGEKAGIITRSVHGLRLHVDPNVVVPAILNVARQTGEPLQATRAVIQRELAAVGVLRTWTDGGAVRYTCRVPDIDGVPGRQSTLWDLDATRIFGDADGDPGPAGPAGPKTSAPNGAPPPATADHDNRVRPVSVAPDSENEAAMREITSDLPRRTGQTGPCSRCGQPTCMYLGGERMHAACWKASEALPPSTTWPSAPPTSRHARGVCLGCGAPTSERAGSGADFLHEGCSIPTSDQPAAPGPADASASVSAPAVAPPSQAPRQPPAPQAPAAAQTPASPPARGSRPATRPAASGTADRRRPAQTPSPWAYSAAVVDVDGVYLPDGTVGAPEQVSTIADLAAIGEQYRIGHPAGAGLLVVTSTLAQDLGLLPSEELLTAPMPSGDAPTEDDMVDRIVAFLAEQTAFLSNAEGWSADGDVLRAWTRIRRENRAFRIVIEPVVWIWDRREESASPFNHLPDVEADPVACWQELARRLERVAELLGVPWSTSPGATGAAIFEQIQRGRSRRGGKVLDAAGPIPPIDLGGQARLEGEFNYRRRPSTAELDAATVVHRYDKRASYLATAGGTDLGYGDPVHFAADASAQAVRAARFGVTKTKMPFGIWLVTLPAWSRSTPPPHPDQRDFEDIQRWITTATLVLLLDEEDAGGAGYTVEELQIAESWQWPDQARFLEPWYTRCRDALLAARGQDDRPVADAIKNVYTGYIGRLASQYTLQGSRPFHHQPVWEATIRAMARASLWRAVQKHRLATGRVPIGIDHDEIGYLDDTFDPTENPPAVDTGRLGALKPSGSVELTDELRQRLAGGASALDKQLPLLPAVLS